ncbi:MAG: hypothetical protein HOM62_22020 [Rhodospirillaceae bacterium]|jgi:hypothetical protein|nr:hypothetical protein [Rhodospirillaceae bacterium]
MKKLVFLPALFLTLLAGTQALSVGDEKTSVEYAKLAPKLLAVIQCSVYSESFSDQSERQRFYGLAISIGREFISAARDNKITKEDWSASVPWIYGALRGGPSVDFVLGRWWQWTETDTYEKISEDCDNCVTNDELRLMVSKRLFREKNCALID